MRGGQRRLAARAAAILGAAAVALLTAACGSDDSGARPAAPEMTSRERETTAPASTEGTDEASDRGTIRIVLRVDEAAPDGAMDALVGTIKQRIETIHVAEPELRNDGERLEVLLPDVPTDEQQSVIELVTRPGTLRLRPVLSVTANLGSPEVTTSSSDPAERVQLPSVDGTLLYTLGPAGADGTIFEADATAEIQNGAWGVVVGLRPGAEGADRWNALAAQCYSGADSCPVQTGATAARGQMAIELDGVVISAPTVNAPSFASSVSIAGAFSEREASELATFLRYGALPSVTVESVGTD